MNLRDEILDNFRKPRTKIIDPIRVGLAVILTILLIGYGIYGKFRDDRLAHERLKDTRYVIGYLGERHKNFKSSQGTIEFSFRYLQKRYTGLHSIGAHNQDMELIKGTRFYVALAAVDPENNQLLLDHPVPDSVNRFSENGWKYMPDIRNDHTHK